jgi:hypothetical protein
MKLTRGELAFGRVRDSAFSIFLTLGAGNLSEIPSSADYEQFFY